MNVKSMSYLSLIKEIPNLNINDLFSLPKALSTIEGELITLGYELYNENSNDEEWYRIIDDILSLDLSIVDYFLASLDLAIILKIQPDNLSRLLKLMKEDKLPLFKGIITSDSLITVNHLSKYTKDNVDILLDYIEK